MKSALIIIVILIVIGFFWFRAKSKNYVKAPTNFVLLESNSESTVFLPTVDHNWLKETELKYAKKDWEPYRNEHTEQSQKLGNDVYMSWREEIPHSDFINKVTKEQKMYFALINFESQTNNGGVYQFLFNMPELSLITLEAMKVAKMDKLAKDYEKVLQEYFGKFDNIQELNKKFHDKSQDWDKRWNSFAEGYKELESTVVIEDYFYEEDYVQEFQSQMVQFVKDNSHGLMKTK